MILVFVLNIVTPYALHILTVLEYFIIVIFVDGYF